MRYWTVQPLAVWYELNRVGAARAWERVKYREWLCGQLARRGYGEGCPWWLYCVKPDLRWLRASRWGWQVSLELELDEARVCRFPIWAWNTVYCGQYLGRSRRAGQEFRARLRRAHAAARSGPAAGSLEVPALGRGPLHDLWPLPSPWREELEASWETLFDAERMRRRRPGAPCEAVVEVLRREDVRRAIVFRGVNGRWAPSCFSRW